MTGYGAVMRHDRQLPYQLQFLLAGQTFYFSLARPRFRERAESFEVLEYDGAADFGVVRARFCAIVLLEPFFQIIGASYVESLIGALQNIGKMHHIVVVYPVRYLWTPESQHTPCE